MTKLKKKNFYLGAGSKITPDINPRYWVKKLEYGLTICKSCMF